MGRMSWAVYLWPGLPHVWRQGTWSGLVVAVGFAALLNVALVGSLVWTELELLGTGSCKLLWLAVAILWIGSAGWSFAWDRRHHHGKHGSTRDDSFAEALDQYLQLNWYEAERTLGGLLRRDPRDLDARLMLATVLRRTGRLDEAAAQLDRLSRMEGSDRWEHEIGQQWQWLAKALRQADEDKAASDNSPDGEKIAA